MNWVRKAIKVQDNEILIHYKSELGIDRRIDDVIKDALENIGYKFIGSGVDLIQNQRDMQFKKE